MIDTPVFKAHLHVEVIPGEGAVILSEDAAKALHGGAYEKIVPLIDGRRSTDEIVDALAGEVDAARVYYVLNEMEAKGYLTEAAPGIAANVAAFWHAAGIEPAAALAALRNRRVIVQTIGAVDSAAMLSALETLGVQLGAPEQADLWLVLTDDYLRADLAPINAAALQARRPWLLVRVTGRELWLGPLFQPGETGCWVCLRRRLERNRAVHRFVAEKKNLATLPFTALGALPATQLAACQMAAVAAAQFLAGVASGLAGKMLSLDWATSYLTDACAGASSSLPCLWDGGKSRDAADTTSARQGSICAGWRAPQCFAGKNAENIRASGQPGYRRGAVAGAGAPG